jgi:7,8-didemethyl-8-hydroxy-5-deazariboflavin synthase CofG subunit
MDSKGKQVSVNVSKSGIGSSLAVAEDSRSLPGEMATSLRGVLDRALGSYELTREEAVRALQATAANVPALMLAASTLRDQAKGRTVTYSRKVFIPLTNLCRDKCGYCTFAKAPKHPDAKTMNPDEILAVASAGREQGCKEALFSLGEKPEERYALARTLLKRLGYTATVDYLAEMCDLVYRETGLIPHANCGVLTREELELLRDRNGSMGLMLESTSLRLLERGQAHFGCVGKVPETRLETMAVAGELGIAFTTGMLIGIGETLEERIDTLFAIRELHQRYGSIQEVIIQNFRVKPDIRMRERSEPTVLDMVRTIAVARLILGPQMNIQAPPNLTPDAYQMYLYAGINDWGGISPVTRDHINPERAWPMVQELREVSAEAGFTLRERLCLYPEFLAQPTFVRANFAERMQALTDDHGLVTEDQTWV